MGLCRFVIVGTLAVILSGCERGGPPGGSRLVSRARAGEECYFFIHGLCAEFY
jgi:hypothetical protein